MNDYKTLYKKILAEYQAFSKCARLHVAALLVENGRILCCGYNGTPAGQCNCNELFTSMTVNNVRKFYLKHKFGDMIYDKWNEVNEDEWRNKHHEYSLENELHAEQNLLGQCIQKRIDTSNASIVISHEPCESCARLIFAAGIKHVMYVNKYDRGSKGVSFLERNGVKVEQI